MNDLELLADFTSYLREKKETGKKIIAFMAHDNIPEELISAAGFIPLRMIFAGNDRLMDESHSFLPPSTCSFAQSCIGLFSLKPSQYRFLDLVDYFIVSNHCVSDICASEIITKYFNVSRLNFYLSYTKTEEALKYYKLELVDLKQQLEKIRGRKIKSEEIIENIKKYNKFKKVLSKINDFEINGSEKLKILQKSMLFGPEILPELESYIQNNEDKKPQTSNKLKNLVFTGCSIFIGDYLIDLIEDSGGNIVFFDTWVGYNYYSQVINETDINSSEDPLDLFVLKYKNNKFEDHSVPNYLDNKIPQIEGIIENYKQKTGKTIDGVINHIIKFCDHFSLFQTIIKQKLQEKNVKVLNLERDYSKSIRGQLTTRIEAFLEMV